MRRAGTVLALLLVACAVAQPTGPALPRVALSVPLVRQATDYSCGAAALLSILFYWRVFDGREEQLYKPLSTTPEHGTAPQNLVTVARAYGLRAEARERQSIADLKAGLARGETVIVNLQAWTEGHAAWRDTWEDGHYVVLVAVDDARAYFMDPSAAGVYAYVPLAELEERWHDYDDLGGKVVKTDRLAIYIKGKTPPPDGAVIKME